MLKSSKSLLQPRSTSHHSDYNDNDNDNYNGERSSANCTNGAPKSSVIHFNMFKGLFTKAGSTLAGSSLEDFQRIKVKIQLCTSRSLSLPDHYSNQECCAAITDLITSKSSRSHEILAEIVFYLSKKMSKRDSSRAYLALSLIEMLMASCGQEFHQAINNEYFTQCLEKLVLYYKRNPRSDASSCYVLAIDLVQCWGEAFYNSRNQFHHVVSLYDRLRSSVEFKPLYENTHAPLIHENGRSGLASESRLSFFTAANEHPRDAAVFRKRSVGNIDAVKSFTPLTPAARRNTVSDGDVRIAKVRNSVELLKDLIYSSSSSAEVRGNDLAAELEESLRKDHGELERLVQDEHMQSSSQWVSTSSEVMRGLRLYDDVVSNKLPFHVALRSQPQPQPQPHFSSRGGGSDLLDLDVAQHSNEIPTNMKDFDPFELNPIMNIATSRPQPAIIVTNSNDAFIGL